MRLLELETKGVRGLPDRSYRVEPGHRGPSGHAAVVVTGPPQAGLTTFLDAIAFTATRLGGSGMPPDKADVLRAGGAAAVIRSTWWLDPDERAFGGLAEETTEAAEAAPVQ